MAADSREEKGSPGGRAGGGSRGPGRAGGAWCPSAEPSVPSRACSVAGAGPSSCEAPVRRAAGSRGSLRGRFLRLWDVVRGDRTFVRGWGRDALTAGSGQGDCSSGSEAEGSEVRCAAGGLLLVIFLQNYLIFIFSLISYIFSLKFSIKRCNYFVEQKLTLQYSLSAFCSLFLSSLQSLKLTGHCG